MEHKSKEIDATSAVSQQFVADIRQIINNARAHAVRSIDFRRVQMYWHYRRLIQIDDPEKREYYELESVNNAWTAREIERQIDSLLYERLLAINDKEAVLAVARKERIPESPQEIIKQPTVLELLGLKREAAYYEKDLEQAIITHIAKFMLEMGKGFSFVARQKRIMLETPLCAPRCPKTTKPSWPRNTGFTCQRCSN